MSTIDPEVPIATHPELIVEWDSTSAYEMSAGYFPDPIQSEFIKFMNHVRHDMRIFIRTMIVVASELRHLRHEGHPVDTDLDRT